MALHKAAQRAKIKRSDKLAERRVEPEGAVPNAAVGAQAAPSRESGFRFPIEKCDQRAQRALERDGVRVEQPDIIRPSPCSLPIVFEAGIIAPGKAEIGVERKQGAAVL